MTLSFVTRWRDELPETYTALSPTPLNNARLIWHNTELANTLSIPSSLFKNGAGVWGGEALLPGMSHLFLRILDIRDENFAGQFRLVDIPGRQALSGNIDLSH